MLSVSGQKSIKNVSFTVNEKNNSGVKTEFSDRQPLAPVKPEKIALANHVALQIFSSDVTKNNNNVVVFLHGGPGLEYNEDFEHVTSWSLNHGYTLVAPEIAGSSTPGLENTSNSYTQTPNYVRDLKSVIQYLRERSGFHGKEFCAVGHSWGGFQLASLLTDQNSSLEDKNFFKQVVFISANLDSAQTRFFATPFRQPPYVAEMTQVLRDLKERHAGSEASKVSNQITVVNNPVMNQALNERFSPFYRLEKMPLDVPYLFFHATDDTQVPASQSIDSFEKINNAGGNAKIIISTKGKHGFFKTGELHHEEVMTACFGAIDHLIKQPDLLTKTTIDGQCFDDSSSAKLESKIFEIDKTYKNYKSLLEDFHKKDEVAAGERGNEIQRKRAVLTQLRDASEERLRQLAISNVPKTSKAFQNHEQTISLINKELEQN